MEIKRSLFSFFERKLSKFPSREDLKLQSKLKKVFDIRVNDIKLYKEAFSLKNSCKNSSSKNYERLEFLGDAVLGTIISEYLYEKHPSKDEGFLTQTKSKIVNRKILNKLGDHFGLTDFVKRDGNTCLSENIAGNILEALIGAVFLDNGYDYCKKIVIEKIFNEDEISKLEDKIISYKGLLLEWSQKKKVNLRYETTQETLANKNIVFRCEVLLDDKQVIHAVETSKKRAEEKAAQRAFYALNKKQNILEDKKTISG